ncbi:hypothetical protein GCM10009133_09130 [Cocleimonas flava]|uniref:Uncharacterized protein n=1 Tax=Cocleimonas flava TaxID=634765 RepID=A0A4V2P8W2_9GAMM|nr:MULTISPECIES: hypothetical protein [Cocleimonas]MEB8431861.1 hypothetical protein [Cocleimonas sp. KMM 6892]MEC4715053.1 hypothetical protein [Cocleimonas sp. KMM 6895]MEC4744133.1 hypothetical protein [Cocleimonas sp. KMM 6896]TCJ87275.1 hypothetical protein EV695_1783 [Cocleimonas flava]
MKALTETTISLFELAEAEGRLLRQKIIKTTSIAFMILVVAIMSLIAICLLLASVYHASLMVSVPAVAYLVTSLVCLLFIGGLVWLAYRLNQQA